MFHTGMPLAAAKSEISFAVMASSFWNSAGPWVEAAEPITPVRPSASEDDGDRENESTARELGRNVYCHTGVR